MTVLSIAVIAAVVSFHRAPRNSAGLRLRFLRYSNDFSGMRFGLFEISNGTPSSVERLVDYSRRTDGQAESRGNSDGLLPDSHLLNPSGTEILVIPCPVTSERWRVGVSCRQPSAARNLLIEPLNRAIRLFGLPGIGERPSFLVLTPWIHDPAD
jgi:hypothetical protein